MLQAKFVFDKLGLIRVKAIPGVEGCCFTLRFQPRTQSGRIPRGFFIGTDWVAPLGQGTFLAACFRGTNDNYVHKHYQLNI